MAGRDGPLSISTGSWGGETDQWTPLLFFANTSPVFPWIGKPGYNLTTDLGGRRDRAYARIERVPHLTNPFFVYYVPGGTHSPAPADQGMD